LSKKPKICFDFGETKELSVQENSRFWTKVGLKSEVGYKAVNRKFLNVG
jgi:hypothetical protein